VRRASTDIAVWRDEMRALLSAGIAPADVAWVAPGGPGLLFDEPLAKGSLPGTARVPKRFVGIAEDAVLHREPGAHALAYRVLWRLTHGEHALLDDAADPDVRALVLRAKAVHRDLHKMHAFVRFRQVDDEDGAPRFVAWYQPDHHILVRAAEEFFVARFASMQWSILTPDASAHWDGEALAFGPGVPRHQAPAADAYEEMWKTYYASIFNPARVNPRVMRQHMPSRYWPSLPESALVPELMARAAPRVDVMLDAKVPAARSLPVLRDAAVHCSACELCGPATQTVFGEGPQDARLVLVGEQPGDVEDTVGRPFVGPAGEVLDHALAAAGIERGSVYVTNAVKHFRFLPRGKQRLHQRPTADQVRACKPWLAAELQTIAPRVVVCLGATAAQSLIGSRFKITQERGRDVATKWAEHLVATHHPAAILRVDAADRDRYQAELIADLARARHLLVS
jgi:uracil-DNA glycosylase